MSNESSLPPLPEKIADRGDAQALVLTSGDASSEGLVRVLHWTESERTTRALVRLGLFWAAAIVSVAVPMLHFCLVPSFFVIGPLAAWLAYRQTSLVLGGVGLCPKCGKAIELEERPDEWPIELACDECRADIRVTRPEKA